MAEGFEKAIKASGGKFAYKSPSETTVQAQVEMLDTLITQKVASITISTNGDTGYEEVFKKAQDAGIKIVSSDSAASPDYRVTHVDQCSPEAIGSALVQAATLIALGVDYPGSMEALAETVEKELAAYTGEEIKLGVLSASVDTPVQNNWIHFMEEELKKDIYAGKVNPEIDKKYGNDDPTESTTQANAFVAEDLVDVIISPTTVGIAAAGQVLKASNSKIRLTGLGLPSEMQSFMPNKADDNAFDFVCPYMMLWDVVELGEVAGATALAAFGGNYDGKIGSTFDYNGKTFTTVEADDGGTRIIALDPYVFYKDNMADWIDKL
jgi:rhamnose transport system substrate-binding protein